MSVVLFVRKIGLFLDLATKINFNMSLPLHEQALNVVLETFLRVHPANYQSGWKLHGSDLRENRTVGSPRLVFHENGPYLVIWAFKKPKK